jgi:hypothetical protein
MTCKETIWTGRYKDKKGIFEILVPACNRDDARSKINLSINNIKEDKKKVTEKIDGEDLIYIEEVGDFDYIREP